MTETKAPLWRTTFHSTLGNLVVGIATAFFGLLGTILGFVPPRGRWMLMCCRGWSYVVLWASGVRVIQEFEAEIDPKQGYVFLANHQSMYDIPTILVSVPSEVRFLAKRSLFFVPLFGWALYTGGFIPVDRSNRRSAQKTFLVAERTLRSGSSIVLFPEETRSQDGNLLPFKRGGLLLAQRTGCPIVPVGISGTCVVKPKGSFHVKPGTVTIRYGRPIPPAGKGAAEQALLGDRVRREIAGLAGLDAGLDAGPDASLETDPAPQPDAQSQET